MVPKPYWTDISAIYNYQNICLILVIWICKKSRPPIFSKKNKEANKDRKLRFFLAFLKTFPSIVRVVKKKRKFSAFLNITAYWFIRGDPGVSENKPVVILLEYCFTCSITPDYNWHYILLLSLNKHKTR